MDYIAFYRVSQRGGPQTMSVHEQSVTALQRPSRNQYNALSLTMEFLTLV